MLQNLARPTLPGLALWLISSLLAESSVAGETLYLIRNETFCSGHQEICIRGTVSYDVNSRLLRLRGRVQSAAGSGLLRIRLIGMNRLGHRRTTEMELSLRGKPSEIINYKMIPDHPDVEQWEIVSVSYEPEPGGEER